MAQVKIPALDKSPMDISYYPNNYPLLKIQDKASEPLLARVIYSRPQKNGRVIFSDLIEYNKVWRLGANEATEIEFYQNVKIGANKIKKGRYTLYAIPYEDKWTFILNSETDIWGSFKYDIQKDILRIEVPVEKQTIIAESFAMVFDKTTTGFSLQVYWDDIKTSLPISL
jgi:hypothetical protein